MEIAKAFSVGQQRAMAMREASMPSFAVAEKSVADLSGKGPIKDEREKAASDRRKVGELVGSIFYNTLIKEMQQSSLKGSMFHGGRGEDAFNGQFAAEISKNIGRSKHEPVSNAIYRAIAHRRGV